jgi:hypothetical protein
MRSDRDETRFHVDDGDVVLLELFAKPAATRLNAAFVIGIRERPAARARLLGRTHSGPRRTDVDDEARAELLPRRQQQLDEIETGEHVALEALVVFLDRRVPRNERMP